MIYCGLGLNALNHFIFLIDNALICTVKATIGVKSIFIKW